MSGEDTIQCRICNEERPHYEVEQCRRCKKFACNSCTYGNDNDLCLSCFEYLKIRLEIKKDNQ